MSYTHHLYKNRYSKSKSADIFFLASLLGDFVKAHHQNRKQYMGKIVLFRALTTSSIICAHGSKKDLAPIAAITSLVRSKEQAYSDRLSFVLKLRISVRR